MDEESGTGSSSRRSVLEGVPRVGFDLRLCPFPGCLESCLRYLGEPADYDQLMGVTGACFRRIWNRDDGGNVDLMYLQPEPYQRAASLLGRTLDPVMEGRDAMIAAIQASIARGVPVIGFGIVGPPEAGLVIGYDGGGDALVGYSYFQPAGDAGPYEFDGWFEAERDHNVWLLVLGDQGSQPVLPARETLTSTLAWAIDLARTAHRPSLPDHVCGLAAYAGWAAALEVDADYPRDSQETLGLRVMVHGDQAVMLIERRHAAGYLRQAAEVAPEVADDLLAAAELYDQVASLETAVWPWGDDMGPVAQQGLADATTRRRIAEHVRRAGQFEAEAVAHLEKAVTRL